MMTYSVGRRRTLYQNCPHQSHSRLVRPASWFAWEHLEPRAENGYTLLRLCSNATSWRCACCSHLSLMHGLSLQPRVQMTGLDECWKRSVGQWNNQHHRQCGHAEWHRTVGPIRGSIDIGWERRFGKELLDYRAKVERFMVKLLCRWRAHGSFLGRGHVLILHNTDRCSTVM